MYDARTTGVRIEHTIRLVLRGDLTVTNAVERIMIIAKLRNGEQDKNGDNKQHDSDVPGMRQDGEGATSDN